MYRLTAGQHKRMKWRKGGLIYSPAGDLWWARSGAQLPTVELLNPEVLRIYYLSKDADGFGRAGYIDVDADIPTRVRHVGAEPVLDLGELGSFDDSGAGPSYIGCIDGRKYLYYQGFQRTERVPYLTFTGVAIQAAEGGPFEKYSRVPITDRTDEEPFIRSTCSILRVGEVWNMWYVSTLKWTRDSHGLHYICVIRLATSCDGIQWQTQPGICLEPDLPDEYAVGRPSVVRDGGNFRMWYSIRSFSRSYHIGYAESDDGTTWIRRDAEAGIEKSAAGWDSQTICYPYVIDVGEQRLMFYNGNGRGLSGFGYAVAEE
jgi:hypothetical protein